MSRNKDILVALSGGLDSAAAVLFLREAGYRPRALFLDLLGSAQAPERAAETAEALGVELIVESCTDLFRTEIIDHVLTEHAAGRTPSPCARCNARIKWPLLAATGDRLGIFHIATGHYVRTVRHENGHAYFRRGADPAKDQSYYLWNVPETLVRRAVLPLGDYTKAEVRDIVKNKYGLTELAERRESMGLCFLDGCSYEGFLRLHLPENTLRPGEVTDGKGTVIGRHEGFPLYTAGQKRRFTLFSPAPSGLAVIDVDAARNRITVGPDKALYGRNMILKEWRPVCAEEIFAREKELQVAVRGLGRNPKGGCRLTVLKDGRLQVTLLQNDAWALMPGQPVVFYLDDRMVGGGILDRTRPEP